MTTTVNLFHAMHHLPDGPERRLLLGHQPDERAPAYCTCGRLDDPGHEALPPLRTYWQRVE